MTFISVPFYHDLYQRESPNLEDILNGVSQRKIIVVCSFVNASLLYKGVFSIENQAKLTTFFLLRHEKQERVRLISLISGKEREYGGILLFSPLYCSYLMEWGLRNAEDKDDSQISNTDYCQIFEALILVAQQENDKVNEAAEKATILREALWPIVVAQAESNDLIRPTIEIVKLYLLVEHLLEEDKSNDLTAYLKKINCLNVQDYVAHIFDIVKVQTNYLETDFPSPIVKIKESTKSLIESMTINLDAKYTERKEDNILLKEKPVYRLNNADYVVMNWNYLHLSIYNGAIFTLYSECYKSIYKSFGDFKGVIGKQISEQKLFLRLMRFVFNQKHMELHFQEELGDCCVLDRNKLYIIEYKDTMLPTKAATSFDYSVIEKDVYSKFVKNSKGKAKGVLQLSKAINKIASLKDFRGTRTKKLRIFPIIVYSWYRYNLPGLAQYLNEHFSSSRAEDVDAKVKHIYPITPIDLQCFMVFAEMFKTKGLDHFVMGFHRKIKRYSKSKPLTVERGMDIIQPFSEYMKKYGGQNLYSIGLMEELIQNPSFFK